MHSELAVKVGTVRVNDNVIPVVTPARAKAEHVAVQKKAFLQFIFINVNFQQLFK